MQDMVNKSTNSQQFPKLSRKDQQAVKVLTEEGLLEPLVMSLKNSTEAQQSPNTTQASEIKSDPMKEDLIRRGFSPEEAEAWMQTN
ncbi:uncharacterized protein METZ01_LOCUS429038 [marine metagenome]|uniref:Uncharacterized protein n=1 Tax=marine metagenome TaxID=408172 RepID=A0A382XZ48_9ZZZZ